MKLIKIVPKVEPNNNVISKSSFLGGRGKLSVQLIIR
jgi:hypothetical protein